MTLEHDERPWGFYTILGTEDGYQVKRIVVQPGKRLSYQQHGPRSEHTRQLLETIGDRQIDS